MLAARPVCRARGATIPGSRSVKMDCPQSAVATSPSANGEPDLYWSALDRQIPEPPLIGAMPDCRDDQTSRARRYGPDAFRLNNPDVINQREGGQSARSEETVR